MACTKNSALHCPEIIYGNAVGVFYCKRGAAYFKPVQYRVCAAVQKQVPVGTVYNAYARYMYIFTFAKKNHLRGAVFVGCEIVIAVRSGRVGVAFVHPKSALTVNSALTLYCDIFLLYCVYKVRACYPFRCEHAVLRAEVLAERAHMSVGRFQHIFKEVAGVSPAEYTEKMRIARAKELLTDVSCDISEIAFKCGFSEHSFFSKRFKKYTGVTPTAYKTAEREKLTVDKPVIYDTI